MPRFCSNIVTLLTLAFSLCWLLLFSITATADPTIEIRKRLLENQRNIYLLRNEQKELQNELQVALRENSAESSEALRSEIADIRDSLEVSVVIINNVNGTISRQRLLLDTLERGSAPSTLDMALNKALNANLSELAKKLAGNEEARREIARLRALLKQQAGLGVRHTETPNSVSYAAEQQLAEDEFLRLLELLSSNTDVDVAAEDKPIKITGINKSTPFSHNEFLSYLGHSQYHLETVVYTGKMTFTVDGRPWHMTVAPEENQATYVIIYDIDKIEQPRLVMFNKSLLSE